MTENLKAWQVFERVCESEHNMLQMQGINEISFDIYNSDISFKLGYNEDSDVFYIKRFEKDIEAVEKESDRFENLYTWLSLINSY